MKMASSTNEKEEKGCESVIAAQLGYRREFVFPNLLKVHVPTIPYEAFDADGRILPWGVLNLLDSGGLEAYWPVGYPIYPYVLQFNLTIDASLYNTESPKFPLILEYTNLFVNKSSRGVQVILYHENMPKPYAVRKYIGIKVDPVTRRPTPYPNWWREKYKFPTSDVKQKLVEPLPPADGNYMTNHRTVHLSDIDVNRHMNYKAYVRFCYESLLENMFDKKHGYGSDGIMVRNIKEIQVVFKRECLLGDVLTIKSWKDDVLSDTYHFELWKQTTLVAMVTLSFYKPEVPGSSQSKL